MSCTSACVRACARLRACARARVCVCACVSECLCSYVPVRVHVPMRVPVRVRAHAVLFLECLLVISILNTSLGEIRREKLTKFSTIDGNFSRRILFPDEYFSPTNTFPRRILFPDEYFSPTNTCPRRILVPDEYLSPTNTFPPRKIFLYEYFSPSIYYTDAEMWRFCTPPRVHLYTRGPSKIALRYLISEVIARVLLT